jgi:hypothetical protein
MISYRITPKRNAYKVESTEDGDVWVAIQSWGSEEQAVSHLKALRAAEEKPEPSPTINQLMAYHRRTRF